MDPEEFEDLFPFGNVFSPSGLVRMGADLAQHGLFGNDSIFGANLCGEFEDIVHTEDKHIDLEALHAFLLQPTDDFFDWENFIKPVEVPDLSFLMSTTITAARPLVPKEQPSPLEASVRYVKQVVLNKRICYVDPIPAYSILIDQRNLEIDLTLYVFYKGTNVFRNYSGVTTGLKNELHFDIADKYVALKLTTGNPTFFYSFLRSVGLNEIRKALETRLLELYRKLGRVDGEQVDWFYTMAPDFVLASLTKEEVWNDLQDLLRYQKSLWFSDSSSNLLKALRLILSKDDGDLYLYDQLFADPAFIKATYHALDGEDAYDGQLMTRKAIFAAILSALTFRAYAKRELPREAEVGFTIGEAFKVDSNILDGNVIAVDESTRVFDLVQWEYEAISTSSLSAMGIAVPDQSGRWIQTGQLQSLHPLTLVELTLPKKDGTTATRITTALEVKDLAHTSEWETVDQLLRVAINVLTIAGSLTGVGAVGWIRVIAWVDIGLSAGDLVVQSLEKELEKTSTGQAFLAAWKELYDWGGLATGAFSTPDAVRSLRSLRTFRSTGTQVLAMISGPDLKLVKLALAQALSASGALKDAKKLTISVDVLKEVPNINIKTKVLHRLEESTVLLVTGEREAGDLLHALVHNGDIIFVTDDAALFGKKVNFLKNKTGEGLIRGLKKVAKEGRELDFKRYYQQGFDYYEINTFTRGAIQEKYKQVGLNLFDACGRKADELLQKAKNKDLRIHPIFKGEDALGARGYLKEHVVVVGAVHPAVPDLVVVRTNYPEKMLKEYIMPTPEFKKVPDQSKVIRDFRSDLAGKGTAFVEKRLSKIKDLYKILKRDGFLANPMHERVEERIRWHLEERVKKHGIKTNGQVRKEDYNMMRTGNLPGMHAELLSINDLLWELEKRDASLLTNDVFEQLHGLIYNMTNFKPTKPKLVAMIRCADCQMLTKGTTYYEIITN